MKSQIKDKIFLLIIGTVLLLPSTSFASLVICGGHELNNGSGGTITQVTQANQQQVINQSCSLIQLIQEIAYVANFMVAVAGIYAILRIIMSGARITFGAGSESMVKEGKENLTNAIIGFILVMLAYLIINTIYMIFQVKLGLSSSYQFPFNPFK